VLETVNTPKFLARVRARAKTLSRAIGAVVRRHSSLVSERGLGLLRAIELAPDARFDAPALLRAARAEGLLLVRGGERAVRLLPPLNVTPKEIAEAAERLDRALTRLESTSSGATT
jgi:acetylornithine/succinyldiaminopimelate/putrescine aminotransferase